MTSHVVYPALDPRRPATLSPRICRDLLRRRLGFRGLLFSDDLEMQAVAGRGAPSRIAVKALAAGCDMLLVCQSLDTARQAMRGVEEAVVRKRLDPADLATSLARAQCLRRLCRGGAIRAAFRWPAHAALARRLAAAANRRG